MEVVFVLKVSETATMIIRQMDAKFNSAQRMIQTIVAFAAINVVPMLIVWVESAFAIRTMATATTTINQMDARLIFEKISTTVVLVVLIVVFMPLAQAVVFVIQDAETVMVIILMVAARLISPLIQSIANIATLIVVPTPLASTLLVRVNMAMKTAMGSSKKMDVKFISPQTTTTIVEDVE